MTSILPGMRMSRAELVGFTHSLAFGLLLTGLGLVFGLLFILLH